MQMATSQDSAVTLERSEGALVC